MKFVNNPRSFVEKIFFYLRIVQEKVSLKLEFVNLFKYFAQDENFRIYPLLQVVPDPQR